MIPLEQSRLCRHLRTEERRLLGEGAIHRRFESGDRIFNEGARADGLFVVLDGQVEITVQSAPGREHVLSRMDAGDYFGEMAVFDGRARSASAIAKGPCELSFVPTGVVLTLLDRSPLLAASMVRDASIRMREFNQRFLTESLRAERVTLVERLARTIVHDFRNPLNVIGIAADLAGEENATPTARAAARHRIRHQISVLNSLLQELLDFTRAGPPNLVLGKVNYADVVRDFVMELQAEAVRRGVALAVPNPLPEIRLRLDPARISRVFTNLAQNAFDALSGREDGRLELTVRAEADEIVTELADNGPGVPLELLPHVFEPFVTMGKAHGTGLGLAICERIVTEHGGRISAHNPPSGGATFRFILPRPVKGDTERLDRSTGT